ncbi:MAG: peptidoglycan editing factor PgeF [Rickettsiaceae bacterium]|nr:peptidoglycan editing factor PgeF [Rickettsiaceae bacterium]
MHCEIVPGKVFARIYNRNFTKSTHSYLYKDNNFGEVASNHLLVSNDLGANRLCVLNQVHMGKVLVVDHPWNIGNEPSADGMVSTNANIALGILTADCVPVLITSMDGNYIAAVHCGWRSLISGIIQNCSNIISQKTSSKLVAVIGPSISQESYEVSPDFYKNFLKFDSELNGCFIESASGKFLCDLAKIATILLSRENITVIKHFDENTFAMPEKYPSHRYNLVNGLGPYRGSILSTIIKRN